MTLFSKKESDRPKKKPVLQLLEGNTLTEGESLSFNKENFSTAAKLLTNITPPRVRVVFNHRSMEKIRALTEACDIEIGALGLMDEHTDEHGVRTFKVYDIFVPHQECSATVTKMTPNGLIELFAELDATYGRERALLIKNKLSYWWHSHVNFGTPPSGQDEREWTTQSERRIIYFMSIGNKRGDFHCNVKLKIPELSNWAQWEIRDVPWSKEWETIVCIKDELHPLLLQEGEKPHRIRRYTDAGAGEIMRDPHIYEWAQQQIESKVQGRTGYFSNKYRSEKDRNTLVLPEELAGIKVEEYQVNAEEHLEDFIVQLFGEKPPVPIPPPAPIAKVEATTTVVTTTDATLVEPSIEGTPATGKEVVTSVTSDDRDLEGNWFKNLFKMPKWWPRKLRFNYYDMKAADGENVSWLWAGFFVMILLQIPGWIVFTFLFKVIRFFVWGWYAWPIQSWIRSSRKKRAKRRLEKEKEKRENPPRKVGTRIGSTTSPTSRRISGSLKKRNEYKE